MSLVFEPVALTSHAPALPPGEAHVWLLPLADTRPDELRAMLDADELARADRLRLPAERDLFIAAHGLMRRVLGHYTKAEPASLRFDVEQHGKPLLRGPGMPQFNLSHSGDWGLLAVAQETPVGVDLEQIRDIPDWEAVAKANFASGEIAALARIDPAAQLKAFYACWTRKEAVVKALGLGVTAGLQTFEVSLDPETVPQVLSIAGSAQHWTLHAFAPLAGTCGALAARAAKVTLRAFSLTESIA
ncbi:MAG: 4-phosphopantetheinyl transferase [Hyphomicrobiales bacterium]|nr:4-phosphopantetheinyl transferase [Hyphomicrobiales bacterium]